MSGTEIEKIKAKNVKLSKENANLRELLAMQDAEIALLKSQLRDIKARTKNDSERVMQAEQNADLYKQWIVNMEQSTSWKITKPVRIVLDKIKR